MKRMKPGTLIVLLLSAMLTAETTNAPGLAQLNQMMARYARVDIRVDTSALSDADRRRAESPRLPGRKPVLSQ